MIMNVWFDLKYAWRLLTKSWGHSLMCASVVALSVGLAVWTWALVYSQMFKPLGITGSEQWYSVQIGADAASRLRPSVDAYTYQELLRHNRSADHLGAFASRAVVLSEGEASTSLRGASISPRLLAATGVAPAAGRMFVEADGRPGAGRVAILSFDSWQRYFAGDRMAVGKTARIDGEPVQIVGIMPREFFAFDDYELWLPMQLPPLARPQDSTMTVFPLILRRPGQDLTNVVNEMKTAVAKVNGDYPRLFNAGRHVGLIPASKMFTHGVTPIVSMMGLMAAAILLLGCVNISMVFLARLLERSRELALRTALGASRSRLLRQCLIETALIVLVGLVAGYGLAAAGIEWTHGIDAFGSRILAHGRSTNLPEMRPADLLIAVVAAVAVWLLSTIIPAWRVARQDAAMVLAGSGKGTALRGSNKSVGVLVGLQVIISCLVLVACGNVVMAIQKEVRKPNGLKSAGVLMTTRPTEFDGRYSEASSRVRYWEDLSASIKGKIPGADAAFATMPPTRPARVAASIETRQSGENQGTLMLPVTVVSDNYFPLMGITLRSGRLFDSTDNSESLPVAVVDQNMAARYWPGEEAIGKRVQLNSNGDWLTVVGVVSAVRSAPYRVDADLGTLYQPMRQVAPATFHALVRVPNAASDSRDAVRAAAYSVDRDLPLHNLQWFEDYLAAVTLEYPAMTKCFIAIAIITTLLAASGLFGLISRSVAQRTQEVGIRRALGATVWRATSMFLRQGVIYLSVAVVGLGIGIAVMPMMSRNIPNILERVVPVTLGVAFLMAAVISTASYLPTRRAVDLEPGDALRYE
jgi:putative ABC transport system permease protein